MSLLCAETGKDIEFGEVLMAGTRCDAEFYSALSQEVLKLIPEPAKSSIPCRHGDGGVDIHEASSERNFNGSYTIGDFRLGSFLFSIPKEVAERYLPRYVEQYIKPIRACA